MNRRFAFLLVLGFLLPATLSAQKISAFPAAASVATTDELVANQSGTTRKLTVAQLETRIYADLVLTGDVTSSGLATTIAANSVALGTDTTGNYALGDAEGGAATTGDSATAFFSAGTIEDARIDGSAEADELVLAGDVDGAANANDFDEVATEAEVESVVDLQDLQGAVTDAQVPNAITVDLATTATTANAGDSATAFFSAGQVEVARGGTGLDTSGSTGVPRIAAGTWSANAGLSHLAASSSSDLAGVLSNETGSGLAVFGTAPEFLTSALLDAEAELRLGEADVNGANYIAFKAPAAITANVTCILEDDGNPIPDSCVGDGTDGGGGGSPGGSDTQVQFNDASAFGGDAGLVYNKTTDALTVGQVNADNLRLDGNTISSTDTNGPVKIDANGSGVIQVGTATQSDIHVYGSFTDASNYQRLRLEAAGSSGAVALNKAGSGDANATLYIANQNSGGAVEFQAGNASRLQITASGHFIALTDNAFDIGALGANRLRDLHLGRNARIGGALILAPETLTIADNGTGAAATGTLTFTKSLAKCDCADPHGCDVTLSETGIVDSWQWTVVNISVNACNFADTSGVSELPAGGVTLGQWDAMSGYYITDRFVVTSVSNN